MGYREGVREREESERERGGGGEEERERGLIHVVSSCPSQNDKGLRRAAKDTLNIPWWKRSTGGHSFVRTVKSQYCDS